MKQFDVIVIGAGPGGYVAAIRCAQLGLKTAVVDEWVSPSGKASLGGTCLNVGCIPSKALLSSSQKYQELSGLSSHGISIGKASININTMLKRKDDIVNMLTGGVEALFLKHKIEFFHGSGRLLDNQKVEIISKKKSDQEISLTANHIIIATGSVPREVEFAPVDNKLIVDSTGALEFKEAPKKLVVIGGGVIGLELGSVWQRLGSEVTILIRRNQFFPNVEQQIAEEALKYFSEQGLNIQLGAQPLSSHVTNKMVTVTYKQEGDTKEVKANKVLVTTGRIPNTSGLNAEEVGLALDEKGFINVDPSCQTNIGGIYAIGDVVRGPMLAHKASEEGVAVAERIAGQSGHVNYNTIPWVIYTHPEIAWVGKTTQQLTEQGIPFKSGSFPFKANGRAYSAGDTDGMVKLIAHAETDELLGAHIIGANASEMIAEAVVAMEFQASAEDLARTIHAHPTLSEAFHEAALAVDKRTIHI
ncbi:Dihydrolipoamide dehydrogenase of 2-oxoglutarate dehydrogenase [hydrothermal vent metagenome]|uniref:Dihydrolipoyl dehydrogenase n=1 Tax=hydrothermal vent metagenome TaxID=652676 RepID=A0A3B0ZA83_9ZZZZ